MPWLSAGAWDAYIEECPNDSRPDRKFFHLKKQHFERNLTAYKMIFSSINMKQTDFINKTKKLNLFFTFKICRPKNFVYFLPLKYGY